MAYTEKEIHEKAVRLVEGGHVWFQGHVIGARMVYEDTDPCFVCAMDSICRMQMTELCGECEAISKKRYFLYLCASN